MLGFTMSESAPAPAPLDALRRARAPLARAWAFARRWGRAVADKFPFTPLGVLLMVAGWLAVLEFGRKRQDLVLYVAGFGAVATIAVTFVLLLFTVALLAWKWTRLDDQPPSRVEAGKVLVTDFRLPRIYAWFPPLVLVHWDWVEPAQVLVEPRVRRGYVTEEVVFGERGEQEHTLRRIVVEDVLGLCRVAWRFSQRTPRTVLPALGRPLTSPLLEAFAGGDNISHPAGPPDGDLVDMRRYAVGDPMKRILWKVYARTRNVMVRLPERAISPTTRTLAYLCAGDGDEAAASVARLAVESDALGPEWRFAADMAEGNLDEDASDPTRALAMIVRSREARARGGDGLGPFLERNAQWGGRCVVFASARPGRWLASVEQQARQRPGTIEVILGVDGVTGVARSDRWRRFFLFDDAGDELSRARARGDELEALTKRLNASGAAVTVIDRPTGKVFARSSKRRRA